jgi:ribA/ribD-fused uncharacterized protein
MPIDRTSLIQQFGCTLEEPILGFFGPFRFLSNFYISSVVYDGVLYNSSEHAYMTQKTFDEELRLRIRSAPKPSDAKKEARNVPLRSDWEEVKIKIMYEVLWAKFTQNPDLKFQLLSTGDRYLEETNTWGDIIWGVCNMEGQNLLGQLLMLLRNQLRGTLDNVQSNCSQV